VLARFFFLNACGTSNSLTGNLIAADTAIATMCTCGLLGFACAVD